MLTKLIKVFSSEKFSNRWWKYIIDEYTYPNGSRGEYHFVRTTGSTMVVPLNSDGRYVLTRQYRYLNQAVSLEFPGGGIKQGLTPSENALEELEEEAGLKAGKLTLLGKFNPFNGVTDEICSVFLAEDLEVTEAKPEVSEEFEILFMTYDEIINSIRKGELWDGMSLASWSLLCYSEFKK